jgi:diacylglycerol kinase
MKGVLRGFGYAFNGISYLIRTGRNFKIQLIAFCIVCLAGFYFNITSFEWLMILGFSALVLSLEALNTSIEELCDLYSTQRNDKIKTIKDITAGAVLIASIFSAIVGVFIFWKYVYV